ncbi:ferritin-like domain-containing protein [Geodermatophilus sp. SYSU D00703]
MIDTREELTVALHEAAELEHGLMIQYLFPAFSMKKRLEEGLSAPQQRSTRSWAATILRVAVEEMGHLGTVCNLLAAIGEGPHFDRPNFPQASGYYPFAFDLVPFSDEALYRMLVFELPQGEPPPPPPQVPRPERLATPSSEAFTAAPDPLTYEYVGELYREIADGFRSIDEGVLFIGPRSAQVDDAWSTGLDMRQIVDRITALAAIDDIVMDGEGAPTRRSGSHYGRFSRIRQEYEASGFFAAARPVVVNPRTRRQRDAPSGATLIVDEAARRVAELFNGAYGSVLLMLEQFFSSTSATAEQLAVLRASTSRMMSVAIRPLGEVLTELPAFGPGDPATAGAPFEIYDRESVSPFPSARWTILLERLQAVADDAQCLGQDLPRVAAIGDTVRYVRRSLAEVAG